MSKNRGLIRVSIGFKLICLISVLLVASVAGITWLSTRLFLADNTSLVRQFNANSAGNLSSQITEVIESVLQGARQIGSTMLEPGVTPERRDTALRELFSTYRGVAGVLLVSQDSTRHPRLKDSAFSPETRMDDPRGERTYASLAEIASRDSTRFSIERALTGEDQARLVDLPGLGTVVALSTPLFKRDGEVSIALISLVKPSRISEPFGLTDGIATYLVDRHGFLIAHSDRAKLNSGEDISDLPVVQALLSGKLANEELRYLDPRTHEPELAAFRRIGFAGLGVIAELPEEVALEASHRVIRIATLASLILLGVGIFAGSIFSGTLVAPINRLVAAAHRISHGDLKFTLPVRGWDEFTYLARTFNQMIFGLQEKERYRETLHKFHDPAIAEKIMKGELKLGTGERKTAVILFCDLRGFTSLSEMIEPEKVVEMLNEYMTRMVKVIRMHGGVVDKYIGDAILAVWGVPVEKSDDAENAVMACLRMREELAKLNEIRIARSQKPLEMGIGLNRGSLVAGNMGSLDHMEYTVIGDSVNLASRIEELTKPYGTDLLISKSVHDVVSGRFVTTPCESASVRGKSEAVELFQVQGFIDAKGSPVLVQTRYCSYDANPPPDKTGNRLILPPAFRKKLLEPATPILWFVKRRNDILGPLTLGSILDGIAKGDLDPEHWVSKSLDGPWQAIAETPEFQRRAA